MTRTAGFSRLRVPVIAGSAISVALGGFAPLIQAADKARPAQPAGPLAASGTVAVAGVNWGYSNSTSGNTGSSGFCLVEASYAAAHPVTTVGGMSVSATLNDALDGGLCLAVSGVEYADPANNITLTTIAAGTVLAGAPATMSGLTVTHEYLLFNGFTAARMISTFTNPTAAAITVPVKIDTNLGSDSNTIYVQSDTGGASPAGVVNADRWTVTMQAYSGTTSSDPRIAMFRYSTGASSVPTVDTTPPSGVNGSDDYRDVHTVTVAPGQTVRIMKVIYVGNSKAESLAFAQANFTTTDALRARGLLAGLSDPQIATIANLGPSAFVAEPARAVPALGGAGLAALGLLVAGAAVGGRRRQRKESRAA